MVIIVISGPSGAGKTTISQYVHSQLRTCGVDVKYKEWELSPEYYFILKLPLKIINKISPRAYRTNQESLAKEFRLNAKSRSLRFLVWTLAVWLDRLLYLCFLKIFHHKDIMIIHRYIYGLMVTLLEYYGWGTKKLTHKLVSCFPKPDILIVLNAPGNILFQRRGDYPSVDAANFWSNRYLEIANQYNFHIIDSSRQESSVVKDCFRIIGVSLTKKTEDLLLHILSDPYGHLNAELLDNLPMKHIDFKYLVLKALQCRVGYCVLNNLSHLSLPKHWKDFVKETLLRICKRREKMLRHIAFIHKIFEENDISYVIFKTCRPYNEVTLDIDVLVDDYQKALKILKKYGWKPELRHVLLKEIHLVKDNITLDLHEEVRGISKKLMLNNRKIIKIGDYGSAYVPHDNVELVSILNNCLADCEIKLGDVHYVRGLVSQGNIKWSNVFEFIQAHDLSRVRTIIGIVKLKDILFYEGKLQQYFPHIKNVKIPMKDVGKPIVPLSSWKRVLRSLSFLVDLYREFILDPRDTFIKVLEKVSNKDLRKGKCKNAGEY